MPRIAVLFPDSCFPNPKRKVEGQYPNDLPSFLLRIAKTESGDRCELTGSRSHHYLYVTHCLVYCRRVYRRADCKCDHAHSLGIYWNHIARHRRIRHRRVDCATVLQTTGGFQISSRGISHVDRRRDRRCLSRATYRWLGCP